MVRDLIRRQSLAAYENQTKDFVSPNQLPSPINSLLQATSIVGDGNCFYYAMSMALFGNQQHANMLKLLLTAEISTNGDQWNSFLTRVHAEGSYNQYLFDAFHNGAWANQDHIFAMSAVLGRPIQVLGEFTPTAMQSSTLVELINIMETRRAGAVHYRYLFDEAQSESTPLTIHHVGIVPGGRPNHFTALLPRNQLNLMNFPSTEMYPTFRNFNIPTAMPSRRRDTGIGGFRQYIKPAIIALFIFMFSLLAWLNSDFEYEVTDGMIETIFEDVAVDELEHHEIINPKTYAQRVYEASQSFVEWIANNGEIVFKFLDKHFEPERILPAVGAVVQVFAGRIGGRRRNRVRQ